MLTPLERVEAEKDARFFLRPGPALDFYLRNDEALEYLRDKVDEMIVAAFDHAEKETS